MYKITVMIGPKEGQTKEEFRDYYLKEMSQAMLAHPEVKRYLCNVLEEPSQELLDAGWGWGKGTDKDYLAIDQIWSEEEDILGWYPEGTNIVGAFSSDELVMRPCEYTCEPGHKSHWLKRITFMTCQSDMREKDFFLHWQYIHGPLALKHHIGAGIYVQDRVTKTLKEDKIHWQGIVTLSYWNAEAFKFGHFSRPESAKEIKADCAIWNDLLDANLVSEYVMR